MSKKIEFSLHSLLKIEILKAHGFDISKEMVEDIIRFPDKIEEGYEGRLVAQKGIDDSHVVRVVYETGTEGYYIVTVYPGRRSRYEKD
ncbi:MAG: DUF4258 domain-containing protein [Thermodesulfobacteriota bacterium]